MPIDQLPNPPKGYRPGKDTGPEVGFETKADASNENTYRMVILICLEEKETDPIRLQSLRSLRSRIGNYLSPASASFMREQRIRIAGALWPIVENDQKARSITVVPVPWSYTADELSDVDAGDLLDSFRAALYARGAASASGWLIAGLHGEYDPTTRLFQLHLHGIGTGEMLEVVERLRKSRFLLGRRKERPVYRTLVIGKVPLTNLPKPLTYVCQSFWSSRPSYEMSNGNKRRVRQKRRIPRAPAYKALLWLDRHRIGELIVMVGLRATTRGLVPTRSA